MRTYVQVKDVNPPDAFQPRTAIIITDKNGGEIELFFESSDQMACAASTLADASMEADMAFRDLMRDHFAQVRDIHAADHDEAIDDARYFATYEDCGEVA